MNLPQTDKSFFQRVRGPALRHLPHLAILLFAAMACASKIAAGAGVPISLTKFFCLLTAAIAVAVTLVWKDSAQWLDGPRLLLVLLGLWFLPSVYSRVGGDGAEYYVQARSLVFDRDLDVTNDFLGLGITPAVPTGRKLASRFPVGLPLFWMPSLVLTHVGATIASWSGAKVQTDGFSTLYQSSVTVTSFVYGFLALILIEGALRQRYGRTVALLSVLAIWLATPLQFYMVANPSMSHAVSAFVATVFVVGWLKARQTEDPTMWLLVGMVGGLMTLVRVQDGVLLLLPLADLVFGKRPRRLQLMGRFLAGPLVCGLIQTGIWWHLYGSGFVATVFSHGKIAKTYPHMLEFLFSPRHGLVSWTPLYVGALAGWAIWLKRSTQLALYFWLAFAAAVIVNSSTGDWWSSESFGQRRMLGMTPLFALGLGETLVFLRRSPLVLISLLIAFLIFWNNQFAYIYNSELVAPRNQAISMDRLTEAQIDVLYRKLLRSDSWMPRAVWVLLYDNITGVWLNDGPRSLAGRIDLGNEPGGYYPLVGDGWFDPEKEGDTNFRYSRGRRSWLTVPIRNVKDFLIVIRARSAMTDATAEARLDVNGVTVGQAVLSSEWSEYSFEVPREVLRPGLNTLTVLYSATPRMTIPGFHGKNATIALDWLEFRPMGRQ